MILTHRLQEAINEAARLHKDQFRKDALRTPYITHLVGVMILLSSATHDEDILIAGLLHDALEDVEDFMPEHLEKKFGTRVKDIVMGVTESSKLHGTPHDSWKEVKDAYLENIRNAPEESVLVSLADKIQNTRSLIEMIHASEGKELEKFGSTHEERVWFNEEVLKIGEERLGDDHVLVDEFRMETEEMKKALAMFA
ncbi:MAG: HD domain-containing protein [Candidatus Paceibacterota bacterium]